MLLDNLLQYIYMHTKKFSICFSDKRKTLIGGSICRLLCIRNITVCKKFPFLLHYLHLCNVI